MTGSAAASRAVALALLAIALPAILLAAPAPVGPGRAGPAAAAIGDARPPLGADGRRPLPPPAREPADQRPAFRSATSLVEVDVIVRDSERRFVDDLTVGDFEIIEDGRPQTVRAMYLVNGDRIEPRLSPAATAVEREAAAGPAAAGIRRTVVWFFDRNHLAQGSFARVRSAAEQHLVTAFRDGDVGGVLIGETMVGSRLTSNRDELVAAVRSVALSPESQSRRLDLQDWPRMSEIEAIRIALARDERLLEEVADRAARESTEHARRQADLRPTVEAKARQATTELQRAAAGTLAALQALVTGLGRVPGRKTVVFLTEGFLFEPSWGALRQIVGLAAKSNVRIYTIDALGLSRRATTTDLAVIAPLETGGAAPTGAYDTVEEGPNTLAVDTGGYVVRGTNDFAGALAEVARDASAYYVLGYSPSNAVFDGRFRSITVRVHRPGVEVRSRRGYVATPPAAPPAAPPAVGSASETAVAAAAAPGSAAGGGRAAPDAAGMATAAGAARTDPGAVAPPADVVPPAAALGAVVPAASPGSPASALVLRPDAAVRVEALASSGTASTGPVKDAAAEGWDRYRRGDLEGAERLLSRAASVPDAAPWVHYALGFARVALGQTAEAASSWEHVRTAEPAFEAVYLDLADAYVQLGDPGRAIAVLRDAESRWPLQPDVLNALGTVQVRRGALNDALETFGRAVAASPADTLGHFNLARTYELRYYQMRRLSRPDARWIASPDDLKRAREHYRVCVELGGPYETAARAALERIGWQEPSEPTS